jgi:two-component system response regulator NreC
VSVRILLVGGDPVARSGLKRLLGSPAVAIAEAEDVRQAIQEARLQQPDVILLDGGNPAGAGDSVRALLAEVPESKALVVSPDEDPASVREAFAAGASGYVLEGAADSEIPAAVRALAAGECYVDPALGARIIANEARSRQEAGDDRLTTRQREVLRLLALGHTNHEIAQALELSVRTVETHRAHVMQKLRISSRAGLVRYAMERGLLTE